MCPSMCAGSPNCGAFPAPTSEPGLGVWDQHGVAARGQNHISVTLFSGWFHPTAQERIPLGAPNPYPQGAGLGFAQYDAARSKPIPGTTGGHRGQGVPGERGVPALSRAPPLPGAGSELLVLTPHHSLLPLQLSPNLPKTPGKPEAPMGGVGELKLGGVQMC